MKIALPVSKNKLCTHFGHCETFIVFDVDMEAKRINDHVSFTAPPHEPGKLPQWLAGKGVQCVLAGGMGSRAIDLFHENGVKVVTGIKTGEPESIVNDFLRDSLVTGENACDH